MTYPHLKEAAMAKRKKVQSLEEQDIDCSFIDLGALEVGCAESATDLVPDVPPISFLRGRPCGNWGKVCCPPGLKCDQDQHSIGGTTNIPGQVALGARAYPRSGMITGMSTGTSDRFKEFRPPVRNVTTTTTTTEKSAETMVPTGVPTGDRTCIMNSTITLANPQAPPTPTPTPTPNPTPTPTPTDKMPKNILDPTDKTLLNEKGKAPEKISEDTKVKVLGVRAWSKEEIQERLARLNEEARLRGPADSRNTSKQFSCSKKPQSTKISKSGRLAKPGSCNTLALGTDSTAFYEAAPRDMKTSATSHDPSSRPERKQIRENRFEVTNSRNRRKAIARAHRRQEVQQEKLQTAIGLHSTRTSKSYQSLGEDPYAEKERLQRRFARENPEEELSKILAGNFAKIPAGNSSKCCVCLAGPYKLCGCGPDDDDDEEIQIGGVDAPAQLEEGSWRLTKGRNTRSPGCGDAPAATAKETESVPIQALTDTSFKKVCVDSGAGESVCPVEAFPSYKTTKTGKTGTTYKAAGGQRLTNVGEIRPCFKSAGINGSMAFQATTDVQKPLAAASKIAAKGNRIVLDDVDSESYIENKKTGKRIPLVIENGVYMMEMLVVPFQGQTKA